MRDKGCTYIAQELDAFARFGEPSYLCSGFGFTDGYIGS
jgi:hypothetical protein